MYSSTVASQQAEAESRRQRERNKAKERKKRRSGSAKGRTDNTASSSKGEAAAKSEEPEDFIAFSKYSDKDSQEEMDDIQMLQQEIVDEDAAEAAAAAKKRPQQEEPEEAQAEPEEEAEEEDAEEQLGEAAQALVDEDAAMEDEEQQEEVEAAEEAEEEEVEEESIAASEEPQDENADDDDDDEIAVDVVDPDADEDGGEGEGDMEPAADGEEEESTSDAPRTSPTFLTPNAANRSKKRNASAMNTTSPSAAPSYPSTQLSTFSFSSNQVQFDAAKHEYVLKFRQGETLCFHGSVAFSIEEGYVEINGHVFNPRSRRSRYDASTESIVQTSTFNAHSWQWQPSALLAFKAVTGGGQFAADEFVTVLRLKACQSRFAPHKLSTVNANSDVTRPTPVPQPYYTLAASTTSINKTPSKKIKKEKQSKNAASSMETDAGSFLRINIPGFTPVLYSDDDFRENSIAESGNTAASSSSSSSLSDSSQRFLYNSLHIPAEWDTTIDTILQPQVSLQNAAAADDAEETASSSSKSLSKSQQLARRVHAKNLRTEITRRGLKILVFGARNSGKSTLLSLVTNKCLNKFAKILYLDLDVGQSQFNPPGMIGLHEIDAPLLSSSTHVHTNRGMCQSKMRWSYFVGDASQQHDPSAVLHATYQAMQIYEKEYGPTSGNMSLCPLVVNTQGWITGLGLELLQSTVRDIVQPVYIIEVKAERDEDESTNSRKRRAQQDGDEEDETTSGEQILGELDHPFQLYTFRRTLDAAFTATAAAASALATAPRLRHLQLLSYFTAGTAAAAASTSSMPPFSLSTYSSCLGALQSISIPFEQVCIDVIGADAGGDFSPSSVLTILNASIIGLCVRTGQVEEIHGGASQLRLRKQQAAFEPFHAQADHAAAAALLDDCIGIGVIRSVDMSSRCFHLLTPLSDEQLARVNVIKKGKLDLPNLAFGVDSYGLARMQTFDKQRLQQSHALPYLSSSSLAASSGLGTREMSSRHNIQRKRLG